MKKKCLIYFTYYPWENSEDIRKAAVVEAESLGMEVIKVVSELRDSDGKELSSVLSNLNKMAGFHFVVPSLDHLENIIIDSWTLLKMLERIIQHRVTFESLEESLSTNEHTELFFVRFVSAIESARVKLKSLRIRNARAEARNAGEQVGAKKQRDDAKIGELRAKGMTIREIARELGISTSPVMDALRPDTAP